MVNRFRVSYYANLEKIQCLSTDIRPVDCNSGTELLELDTKKKMIFDSKNINPATGDGWWDN